MAVALSIVMLVSDWKQKEYIPEYLQQEVEFDTNNLEEKADYIKSLENAPVIITDDNLTDPEE